MNVEALTEELAASLKLVAQAEQDAVDGLPATTATSLAAAEVNALTAAEEAGKRELGKVAQAQTLATTALNEAQSALAQVRSARESIEDEPPPPVANLELLVRDRDRARAAYTKFQSDHGLLRDATGDDRVVQVVWASVAIGVESCFNAYFYTPISDLGLLGGLLTAFFVSFANVGVAFVGGALGLRYLGHVEPAQKLGGVVWILVSLLLCLSVIALSALFRGHVDLLSDGDLDSADLGAEAWQAAVQSLFALDFPALFSSLNSFLLVFVGLICAVIGFWKGREFDDPYPGFGAALRNREKAEEALEKAEEEANAVQRQWQQDRRAKLRSEKSRLDRSAAEVESAVAGYQRSALEAGHLAEQTEQLATALLSLYRQKNQAVRSTAPPSYFAGPPGNSFASLEADLVALAGPLAAAKDDASRFVEACRNEQANLQAAIAAVPMGG